MHRLITGSFPALAGWLRADITATLSAPAAPDQFVLLNAAGLAGKRLEEDLLGAGVSARRIQRSTLSQLARRLVDGIDAGRLLPRYGDDALLRQVAATLPSGGPLATAMHRPGLRRATLRAAGELQSAGFANDADLAFALITAADDPTCGNPALLRDLARTIAGYRAALAQRSLTDAPGVLAAARRAVERGAWLPGPVYLYGVLDLSGAERQFIMALAARTPLTVLLPHDGTPAARWLDPSRDFFRSLGCVERVADEVAGPPALAAVRAAWSADDPAAAGPPPALAGELAIIAVPGSAREVREAAREAVRAAQAGVPLPEIAILFRDGDTYRRLVHETLAAVEVPHYLPGGLPLGETRVGRALAGLLALSGPERRRAAVMELLLTAPLRWPALLSDGAQATPEAWDLLTREAGIVGGAAQWRERPDALRADLEGMLAGELEATGARAQALTETLTRLAALSQVVTALFARLDALDQPRPWAAGVAHLQLQVQELFDDPRVEDVITLLDDLRRLEGLEPDGHPQALHAAVTRALATTTYPVGDFDTGLFVGDLTNARGLSFHTVLLLGVAERSFPAPPPRDPVLDEDTRRAINAVATTLPGTPLLAEQHPGYEDLLFQQVLYAARERLLLLYPSQDADGRERPPSYLLLRVAEVLNGVPVEVGDLPRLSFVQRMSPSRLAPADPAEALTLLEYDVAELERALAAGPHSERLGYLDQVSPEFARARQAVVARAAGVFGAHGGVFMGAEARQRLARRHGLGSRILAATDIEMYARCPRRYFLSRVLRLDRPEEPEAVRRIRPDVRGTLVHAILQRFYEETQAAGELPLHPEYEPRYRQRLAAVAAQCCAEEEQRGRTGAPLVWEVERLAIEEDLSEWLTAEIALAQESGLIPVHYEAGFGTRGGALPAVTFDVDGIRLAFRARVDRIDRSADGRTFRVVDYKTGRRRDERDGLLRGGTAMQLPVYLRGALALMPDADGSAEYHYVTRTGTFARVRFDLATLRERETEIATVLRITAEGVAAGRFLPHPGEKAENCRYCPFAEVCERGIASICARRRDDPDAAALRALEAIA